MKYLVTGKFGSQDKSSGSRVAGERKITLNLLTKEGNLNYGMGKTLVNLSKMGVYPSEIGADFLILACLVQAADTCISRVTESQDTWTREIRIVAPVSNLAKWNSAAPVIKRTLNFLTGDIWDIGFRPRPKKFKKIVPPGSRPLMGIPFDRLSLFSGGLDSLVGAIDILEKDEVPLLISHVGDGYTSDAQDKCFTRLKAHYKKVPLDRLRVWMSFGSLAVRGIESEKTTRSRSFLFFAIGILAGTGLEKHFTLNVPENGFMTLNPPLDSLRVGSLSTRTTHPFYIIRWNEILKLLNIDGQITNPYFDKTKGEMVKECKNKKLLVDLVSSSLSCSSPAKLRWKGKTPKHCGYCLPCLIRRAALDKGLGKGNDPTTYQLKNLTARPIDTKKAEGQQIRSLQYMMARLRRNPSLKKLSIHSSGSLSELSLTDQRKLLGMYSRAISEMESLLEDVATKPK